VIALGGQRVKLKWNLDVKLEGTLSKSEKESDQLSDPLSDSFLIKGLFFHGIVKFGRFILTSGVESPVYVDMRAVPSRPPLFRRIIGYLITKAKELNFDAICGVATGGIPHAAVMSYELGVPMAYVRSKKTHGLSKSVEGLLDRGSRVLLVDDVSTTGGSIASAVETLRRSGLVVEDALVILDRNQGAESLLMGHGIKLHSVLTLKGVMRSFLEMGLIPRERYEEVMSYIEGCDIDRGREQERA